jgi:hypothetical protein
MFVSMFIDEEEKSGEKTGKREKGEKCEIGLFPALCFL